MQERLQHLFRSRRWEQFIIGLIVVNAIFLGLETSDAVMRNIGGLLLAFDTAILAVFVIEIVGRIYAFRGAFFRDPWSIFDFTVVGIALLPATGPLTVLRALRILRVLRLISVIPSLRRVIGGLIAALPGMGSIIALLAITFYIFAVMATKLFGDTFPQWFGDMGASIYTLFQVMTLESWSMGIVRPVMEVHPYAWLFFVPFILSTTYAVLNLFIGVIVSAMQGEHEASIDAEHEKRHNENTEILAEVKALRAELAEMRAAKAEG
ncbi:voltage-gated sodium channel [Fulvimarina pelagi HTCC2506]|uniref:Voltage-gated sodium channel n=1 Tax=Fulvimarina pelagi HTCC2506 TaxID=314231 RepID=Q0FZH3_9HYPH|nr:ion transporter [Fulvimarina pelagi]EAU40305.1 voltage-gated sodium channel [Fulvimarina pelagi HTCC2506]